MRQSAAAIDVCPAYDQHGRQALNKQRTMQIIGGVGARSDPADAGAEALPRPRWQTGLARRGNVLHRWIRLLKTYKGFPHGMPTTHPEIINADLLAFIES
jgi:hypothetical protein